MTRTLIVGASGSLGSHLLSFLSKTEDVMGTYFSFSEYDIDYLMRLDATNEMQVKQIFDDFEPTRVINCAGLVDIELCELKPEASWALNYVIPFNLAEICKSRDISFINFSTDHYFSESSSPRRESDLMLAINQYGLAKLESDLMLQNKFPDALILRTNFFGHTKRASKSLFDFALKSAEFNLEIRGFKDVFFSPIGMSQIAKFLQSPISNDTSGILNLSGSETLSKYDFLRKIFIALLRDPERIDPILIQDSMLKVKRPRFMALDNFRLRNELVFSVPSLDEMIGYEIDLARQRKQNLGFGDK